MGGKVFRKMLRVAGMIGIAVAAPALAQSDASNYPNQAIRVIVPYPPGGGSDFLARLLSERVQARWGQSMIVENRVGAGGNVGTEAVFRAQPDGYTMLFTANPPMVSNKALYAKMNFDPDLMTPVTVMCTGYSVLLVHPKLAVNSVQEFIAYARANPGKLMYASQGIGNGAHLTAELFSNMAGVKMVHVPYKGTGPALADTLTGQVDLLFGELATAGPHVKAGKLKLLGTGGLKRHPDFAQVPAIAEFLPGFQALIWQGMVGPPGLPMPIARKWQAFISDVVKQPDVAKRLGELSMIPTANTPEEMAVFLKEDRERWAAVIKATGARAE